MRQYGALTKVAKEAAILLTDPRTNQRVRLNVETCHIYFYCINQTFLTTIVKVCW